MFNPLKWIGFGRRNHIGIFLSSRHNAFSDRGTENSTYRSRKLRAEVTQDPVQQVMWSGSLVYTDLARLSFNGRLLDDELATFADDGIVGCDSRYTSAATCWKKLSIWSASLCTSPSCRRCARPTSASVDFCWSSVICCTTCHQLHELVLHHFFEVSVSVQSVRRFIR